MFASFNSEGYQYSRIHGNLWQLIFFHNFTNKSTFQNESEALFCSSVDKYSILLQLTDIFKIGGKFEFIIEYPQNHRYYQWRQTNNPLHELEVSDVGHVAGFEPIYNSTYIYRWGGLVRTNIKFIGNINSLLDGNPGISYWQFAIGMYANATGGYNETGIPADSGRTDMVRLWLKLPRILYSYGITCNLIPNHILPSLYITLVYILLNGCF